MEGERGERNVDSVMWTRTKTQGLNRVILFHFALWKIAKVVTILCSPFHPFPSVMYLHSSSLSRRVQGESLFSLPLEFGLVS